MLLRIRRYLWVETDACRVGVDGRLKVTGLEELTEKRQARSQTTNEHVWTSDVDFMNFDVYERKDGLGLVLEEHRVALLLAEVSVRRLDDLPRVRLLLQPLKPAAESNHQYRQTPSLR